MTHRDAYMHDMHDGVYSFPQDQPRPCAMLTVSDVERLAKAGVTVDFKDIASQVQPDEPVYAHKPRTLEEAFWERWRRANTPDPNDSRFHESMLISEPWRITAHQQGSTVFVFVGPYTGNGEPFILEDEAILYPSDALIAKLHLQVKTK